MDPEFKGLKYEDRLRKLKLNTLEERRNRADLILLFKIYKNLSQPPFNSLFQLTHHRLNGSSSPVLTATSLSYGKSKNSTPHRINPLI